MSSHPSRLLANGLLGLSLCGSIAIAAESQTRPTIAEPASTGATISIVIDDLGHNARDGRRVIALPAPVALAILPHTPYGATLADEAYRADKEILLHLPMDPEDGVSAEAGPGRIENEMSSAEISAMFSYDLQTVPHVIGVNNHMGSRITRNTAAMSALMGTLHKHGRLFFLDSRTSSLSVAARVGAEHDVAVLERDVFLDHDAGEDNVTQSIQRTERLLVTRSHVIVIGHPYPETLAALERWLPSLTARGIRIVPLSVMLKDLKAQKLNDHADRPAPARVGL